MNKRNLGMKISALVLSFALALTLLAGISFNVSAAENKGATDSLNVYRAYNPGDGDHLYTTSASEYQNAVNAGWDGESTSAWKAPSSSSEEVWRAYNPNSGEHMFMTSQAEAQNAINAGWRDEGIGFYGVADEASVVSLIDEDGLQTDGTAALGDTLAVVFGSEFGTPVAVTWYKDGAVIASYKDTITAAMLRWVPTTVKEVGV